MRERGRWWSTGELKRLPKVKWVIEEGRETIEGWKLSLKIKEVMKLGNLFSFMGMLLGGSIIKFLGE